MKHIIHHIIEDISNKEYNSASEAISETLSTILEKKMVEMKKMMMAKEQITMNRKAFDGNPGARAEKLYRDVVEVNNPNMDSETETNKLAEEELDEAIKDEDKHFESQSQKMQDAINLHLRNGKDYAGAVKAAKVHVKEELEALDEASKLTNDDWKKDSKDVKTSKDSKFVLKMIDKWGNRGSAWMNHPALKESEINEARIKIIKARVRGGKVQRRKKVSNVAGYTFRGGQLKRISPMERRRRKLGQRRGKIKRRAKLQRTLVKRKRSLRKRQSIGLK